jgi:uncharacterized protein YfdQ (DUF2303 family)
VGLTDGEGCERFWALIRHLIPSLQTSSEYGRAQIITAVALVVAEGKKNALANSFRKSFLLALRKIQQSNNEVNDFCTKNDVSKEILQEQRSEMHNFFANPLVPHQDYESRICELLHVIKELEDFQELHRQKQRNEIEISCDYMKLRIRVNTMTSGRIELGLGDSPDTLHKKLKELLKESGMELSTWKNTNGTFTEQYYTCHKFFLPFTRLVELKQRIWTQLLHRQLEFQHLFRSSVSGTPQ